MSKKVLVVESIVTWCDGWKTALKGKVELVVAPSIEQAEMVLGTTIVFDAIVIDTCIRSMVTNTIPLVKKLRAKPSKDSASTGFAFTGPMIATSGFTPFRRELVAAGCDHECDKESVPRKLCEILGLPAPGGTK